MDWISVAERLPDEPDYYLVCNDSHTIVAYFMVDPDNPVFSPAEDWAPWYKEMFADDPITNWMPFPKPVRKIK